MTSGLPSFDDWLNHQLVECAREVGEDVATYVARAVASRMVSDLLQAENPSVKELLARLSESEVLTHEGMPDVSAAIGDPDRLRALHRTELLDSPPDEVYDRITRAAAAALDAPHAAVALVDVDRQFFKSAHGMGDGSVEDRQTPLELSICQYAVANGAPLILEDARRDPVFRNHPVVRGGAVAAYLGMPLIDHEGNAIGTLCVFDSKPRLWSTGHVQVLGDLANLVGERIFGSGAGTDAKRPRSAIPPG
ncbi:GAF domain-containing protein [Mycobacterium deserti]|uniref:GAF domain-containing protein n=1 Tax=Mycobacterium deserti TaxID=2978347 RepID=A0ABT2M694_9MYCO|nr:GAF domain-containing protein [Mycobacterium deserti]MCT7657787.1 GAF domain-containing protein [Mycobacterium deserti]